MTSSFEPHTPHLDLGDSPHLLNSQKERQRQQMFDIPPLSFDRVHPGHRTTSNFPLFTKLPVELFPHVTRYLTRTDLDALAGVDRDCRLLAGLGRFKDVRINFRSDTQIVPAQFEVVKRHRMCVRRLNVECIRDSKGPER